jgi:hypothetical protein
MAAEENLDIDLPAAALRADGADLEISIEALATSLEQALPGIASVERRKVGGFRSKRREVRRIAVPLGEEQFELLRDDQRISCTRHKVVRGITLSRQELPMADWIAELVEGLTRGAEVSDRNRIALEGLLR